MTLPGGPGTDDLSEISNRFIEGGGETRKERIYLIQVKKANRVGNYMNNGLSLPMSKESNLTPLQKLYAVIVMVLFATPNLYYAACGREDFPYTCALMFGHYIGKGTQFYSFKFIGESESADTTLPSRFGQLSEIATMRFFFSKVYGSCRELSAFGDHLGETPQQFEERLSRYFKGYLSALSRTEQTDVQNLKRLRLEVWCYGSEDRVDAKHIVGYYTPHTEKFTHQWQQQ